MSGDKAFSQSQAEPSGLPVGSVGDGPRPGCTLILGTHKVGPSPSELCLQTSLIGAWDRQSITPQPWSSPRNTSPSWAELAALPLASGHWAEALH